MRIGCLIERGLAGGAEVEVLAGFRGAKYRPWPGGERGRLNALRTVGASTHDSGHVELVAPDRQRQGLRYRTTAELFGRNRTECGEIDPAQCIGAWAALAVAATVGRGSGGRGRCDEGQRQRGERADGECRGA
ncbi:hypothetical protein FM119_04690 [Mycetocola reblochoni REB411]|uniref:Uncharacterized protein n=1 Tax=Mycetocola reblochoni REB411 TaxID=1255698 RepID=A0A1R4J0B5_9MICO|nr:hypothetical protein FM119_04690 [Mycetocola reblochoni REB411]